MSFNTEHPKLGVADDIIGSTTVYGMEASMTTVLRAVLFFVWATAD